MDILIKNGTVIDGTGGPSKRGDVLISQGRIREIGEQVSARSDQTINAEGLVVAPGFVDILNHADAYLTLLRNPQSHSLLAQGITTVVIGNCGASLAPITDGNLIAVVRKWADVREMNIDWERFGEFLDVVDRFRPGVNVAGLVGHTTLRRSMLGDDPREPKEEELDAMVALLEGAFADGAFGLSFAPSYAHARVAPQWEIDALAQAVARKGGYLAVHLRDDEEGLLKSLAEAIGIARRANIPLEVSHLRAVGHDEEKQFSEAFEIIRKISEKDVDIHFDVFPWNVSLTVIYLLFPQWAQEGGLNALGKRLGDTTIRSKIVGEMKKASIAWDDYVVADAHRGKSAVGKSIVELAAHSGVTKEDAVANLFLAHEGRVLLFRRGGNLDVLKEAMKHPRSFIASAGGGYALDEVSSGTLVHPRSFGTMPEFLGRYVREEEILPIEEAVAKITSRPAAKVGLEDRGTLAVGASADVVVFDAQSIRNRATLEKPFQYPEGVHWVLVNGTIAVNPDGMSGARAGTTLRRESRKE